MEESEHIETKQQNSVESHPSKSKSRHSANQINNEKDLTTQQFRFTQLSDIHPIILLKKPKLYKQCFEYLFNQGGQLLENQNYEQSIQFYEKSIQMLDTGKKVINKESLPQIEFMRIITFTNMACAYLNVRKLQKCNKFAEKAIEEIEKFLTLAEKQTFLKIAINLMVLKFQNCAILSQLQQHERSLELCKSNISLIKKYLQLLEIFVHESLKESYQKGKSKETVSFSRQLIQTAIDGINVCIFAYGQTGSGKTFTMQGIKQNKQLIGVIPRSINLIFQQLSKTKSNNVNFQLSISVNEIYNDTLVNLSTKSILKNTKPIFINVNSVKEVENQFNKAVSNRSTAFTLSNADSSRSHLIFIIRIKSKNQQQKKQKEKEKEKYQQSHLILIDLAGSQRVKQSGVSHQRLKEAQHINSSLSQLGQVIRSLKSNKGKTNFRNSKLTFFLQPYLQKGSKAVMFVNISPAASDESQTINSLNFADIARSCKMRKNQ